MKHWKNNRISQDLFRYFGFCCNLWVGIKARRVATENCKIASYGGAKRSEISTKNANYPCKWHSLHLIFVAQVTFKCSDANSALAGILKSLLLQVETMKKKILINKYPDFSAGGLLFRCLTINHISPFSAQFFSWVYSWFLNFHSQ